MYIYLRAPESVSSIPVTSRSPWVTHSFRTFQTETVGTSGLRHFDFIQPEANGSGEEEKKKPFVWVYLLKIYNEVGFFLLFYAGSE